MIDESFTMMPPNIVSSPMGIIFMVLACVLHMMWTEGYSSDGLEVRLSPFNPRILALRMKNARHVLALMIHHEGKEDQVYHLVQSRAIAMNKVAIDGIRTLQEALETIRFTCQFSQDFCTFVPFQAQLSSGVH